MNGDDQKIDLSALDPTRDQLRFERMVRGVASQAAARPVRPGEDDDRLGASALAIQWWKPSLALAACLALAAWAPQLFLSTGATETSASADPGATLLTWTTQAARPSAAEVLQSLGSTP